MGKLVKRQAKFWSLGVAVLACMGCVVFPSPEDVDATTASSTTCSSEPTPSLVIFYRGQGAESDTLAVWVEGTGRDVGDVTWHNNSYRRITLVGDLDLGDSNTARFRLVNLETQEVIYEDSAQISYTEANDCYDPIPHATLYNNDIDESEHEPLE